MCPGSLERGLDRRRTSTAAVLAVAADNLQFVDSPEMLAFFDKFPVELHHHGSLNSQKHIFEEHARFLEVKGYHHQLL